MKSFLASFRCLKVHDILQIKMTNSELCVSGLSASWSTIGQYNYFGARLSPSDSIQVNQRLEGRMPGAPGLRAAVKINNLMLRRLNLSPKVVNRSRWYDSDRPNVCWTGKS